MVNLNKMIFSGLCLTGLAFLGGCGGGASTFGTLQPIAPLPAFTSSWDETITKDSVNHPGSTYYFDANNQLVAMKLPAPSDLDTATTQIVADTLVLGKEVTRFILTTSTLTAYLNITLTEGSIQRSGDNVTFTFTYTTKNPADSTLLTTKTTLTGTTTDGTTLNFTQITTQTTPTDAEATTQAVTSTWVLKTGNAL